MADSPVPALIDGIVVAAKAHTYFKPNPAAGFSGRLVFDGPDNTDDPGDFLMIGVEDPDLRDTANSAETTEDYAHVGLESERDSTGTITCAALSWNGDGDLKVARDAAYGMRNAVAELCRTNSTFGVSSVLWTSCGTSEQLNQAKDTKGALALVIFRIFFHARI